MNLLSLSLSWILFCLQSNDRLAGVLCDIRSWLVVLFWIFLSHCFLASVSDEKSLSCEVPRCDKSAFSHVSPDSCYIAQILSGAQALPCFSCCFQFSLWFLFQHCHVSGCGFLWIVNFTPQEPLFSVVLLKITSIPELLIAISNHIRCLVKF